MPGSDQKLPDDAGPDAHVGGWLAVAAGMLALAALATVTLWATGALGANVTLNDGDTRFEVAMSA